MKRTFWRYLKLAWVLAVVGAVILYLRDRLPEVQEELARLSVVAVLASVGCLLAGKVLLAEVARRALAGGERALSLLEVLRLYSLSQLGKYLPGGVWHFVGRGALYRAAGLSMRTVGRALLIENVWLVSSACAVGLIAVLPEVALWLGAPGVSESTAAVTGLRLAVGVVWLATVRLAWGAMSRGSSGGPVTLWIAGLQGGAWIAFGVCFWLIARPTGAGLDAVRLMVGAFSLGWVAGYLTPFAPAGLGVREGVLGVILAGTLGTEGALVCACVSRILWTFTELGLAGFAYAVGRARAKADGTSPGAGDRSSAGEA